MTETIEVPSTYGQTVKIMGTTHGLFFVHKNLSVLELDFEEYPCWSVTHPKTGMRFPWSFMTEEAAVAFCDDVLPVMAWADVEAAASPSNPTVATWGKNEPTKEQSATVRKLALMRGGFRGAVKTAQCEEIP